MLAKASQTQGGLFSTEQAPLDLPTCPEMPLNQLLSGEWLRLGTFVSQHPCDPFKAKFADRVTHGCSDYHGMVDAPRGSRICLIAMIMEVSPRGRIAWLRVQDDTGEGEILCFSDELERYRFALRQWSIAALSITVRRDPSRSPTLTLAQAAKLGEFRFEKPPVSLPKKPGPRC